MRIRVSKTSTCLFFAAALLIASLAVGCQQGPATNSNANTNANATNANAANLNANTTSSSTAPVINTREPETYRATMVFSAVTEGGERVVGTPEVSLEVAKNGNDRRVSFKLPNGEQLIYLDHANTPYVISVNRKQYAELTPDATGFQMQKLMTPGQVAALLQQQKGFERVGEEQYQGRTAVKYHYATAAQTSTQAGTVTSDINVYIDQATELPLHAEIFSQASGDVQGVKGARVVAEMRDIQTTVDPSMFEVPQGYIKVAPEQIRQQVDAWSSAVAAIIKTILTNLSQPGSSATVTTTVTTTTASPSPSASASNANR